MAIVWGSSEGNNVQKVGIETTMSPSTVTASTNQVTLTIKYYTYQKYYSGDNQTLNKTGDYTGSDSYYMPATADYKLRIDTDTRTVNTVVGSSVTKNYGANISGHYGGATPSVSTHFTVPARPSTVSDVPAAPTSCAASRVSDTQFTVTWTNNPTGTAPYTYVYVERWDNVSNAWAVIAQLGVVTSYSDTTTIANRKYQYRVRAWNGVGYSATYSTSGFVYSTPAAPSACEAARTVSDIVITWADNSAINDYFEVWESVDGGAYSLLATQLESAGLSYTHAAPSTSVTHTYKVRAKLSTTSPVLYSDYSAPSNVVGVIGAPSAPTGLVPSGVYVDAHDAILVDWNHNPIDGTAQTYREIWHRLAGGTIENWKPLGWGDIGAATITIATPGVVTKASHGLTTGDPVKFTTTGALPTGITAGTQYYAVVVSTSTFSVATTYANAIAETKIATSGSQSGTHSLWVGRGASSVTTFEIPVDTLVNGNNYEIQIRTWGQYSTTTMAGSASPWSPIASFATSSLPEVVIQTPVDNGTLSGSKLYVTWTYTDEGNTAQTAYRVNIYTDADVLLKSVELLGTATAYNDTMTLEDATDYKVGVLVRNGADLWSVEAINLFTVAYVPPVAPVVTTVWDGITGSVTLNITNPPPTTEPTTIYNEVWRSINGEEAKLLITGMALNSSLIDYLPAVGGTNVYSVIAYSNVPTVKTTTVQLDTAGYNEEDWVWLNAGPNFSQVARANGAPRVGIKYGREKVLHTFAGRRSPVEFAGDTRYRSIDLEINLKNADYSRAEDFEKLTDLGGIVAYRDPYGRRIFCSMGDVAYDQPGRPGRISMTLTEVYYEEGVS